MSRPTDPREVFRLMFDLLLAPFGSVWLDSRVAQAREQLSYYSDTDRDGLRLIVFWLLDGAPNLDTGVAQIDFSKLLSSGQSDHADLMHACEDQLANPPAIKKDGLAPSWQDLYSVLALEVFLNTYIGIMNNAEQNGEYEDHLHAHLGNFSFVMEGAAQACELLAYSRISGLVTRREKERATLIATRAGLARHQKLKPFKEAVRVRYEEKYRKLSNRAAAQRILRDFRVESVIQMKGSDVHRISYQGQEVLRSSGPEKTIEVWIANFKRVS